MPNVIGVGHLDGVFDDVVLYFIKDIFDQLGFGRNTGIIKDSSEVFHGDRRMYPALFLEKVMDHVQQMDTELYEPVRGLGHYEQLLHVLSCAFDSLTVGLGAELQ
jgi:hypothetical protein